MIDPEYGWPASEEVSGSHVHHLQEDEKYPWSEVCRAYDIIKGYSQEEHAFLDVEADRNYWAQAYIDMRDERDRYKIALDEIRTYIAWKASHPRTPPGFVGAPHIQRIVRRALDGTNKSS